MVVPPLPAISLPHDYPKRTAGRSVTEQAEDFVAALEAFAHRFAGLVTCVLRGLSRLPTMQSNRN